MARWKSSRRCRSRDSPGGTGPFEIRLERVVHDADGQASQGIEGIYPARAQHHQGRPVTPAVFEHIDGAKQVVLDELAARGVAVHPGEHARIGGGVDDDIGRRQHLEVGGETDVGVMQGDAERAQSRSILLAARAHEVVETDESCVPSSTHRRISVDPTNPQAPVTRISHDTSFCCQAATISRNRLLEADRHIPSGIVRPHLPQIAVVADVIADPVVST